MAYSSTTALILMNSLEIDCSIKRQLWDASGYRLRDCLLVYSFNEIMKTKIQSAIDPTAKELLRATSDRQPGAKYNTN